MNRCIKRAVATRLKLGSSVMAMAAVASIATSSVATAQETETLVVTGFKASLERALDAKRGAAGSGDSILAEDIAKFPDINLSESIQRIPGVALNRAGGEGRQIAVRGLSPLFTTTRINGMETLATAGDNTGRSFDFNVFASDLFSGINVHKTASADISEGALGATVDLNTVHPFDHQGFTLVGSAEGSYNDLNGAINSRYSLLVADQFLGGKLGVLAAAGYQSRNLILFNTNSVGWQNDNTDQTASHASPLLPGCVNGCSAAQRFGSLTVQGTGLPGTMPQIAGTVQTNTPCNTTTITTNCNPSALASSGGKPSDYDVVNQAYHDRFPRYIFGRQWEKRAGATSSVQYQPDDQTLVTLDMLWANLQIRTDNSDIVSPAFGISGTGSNLAPAGAPPLRANTLGSGNINIIDYSVNQRTNNLEYLAATNVGLTSERAGNTQNTLFSQVSLNASHEFSSDFKIDGLVGWSESHYRTSRAYLLKIDYNCTAATSMTGTIAGCPGGVGGGVGTAAKPYIVDFRGAAPGLFENSVGQIDPTSPNGWFFTQYRNTPVFNFASYRSANVHLTYKVSDEITLEGGASYKNFGYRTAKLARFAGGTASLDSFIPTSLQNAPIDSVTEIHTMRGMKPLGGTPTSWIVPSVAKLDKQFRIFDQTAENFVWSGTSAAAAAPCNTTGCSAWLLGPGQYLTQNGTVREVDSGGWLMMDWDSKIGRVPFRGNVGIRYAQTDSLGQGYNFDANAKAVVPVTISNIYHDWLPSMNAVVEPADDFLIRLSLAKVMSRPNLPDLVPGISATKSGTGALAISGGNALLSPYRAKTADVAFEWYYDRGALFSMALFYKHIDTLIASQNTNVPYAGNPFGLPTSIALAACGGVFTSFCDPSLPANFTFKINQKGSPLYGTEINWQQPFNFEFLPDYLQSFGLLSNVTFVQARQTYLAANGTVQAIADLENMSRTSWNATFYYDDGVFQARVSAASRSRFLNTGGVNPGNKNDLRITRGSTYIDFSASYEINENILISLQGLNLSNERVISYLDSVGQRLDNGSWTGRELYLGIRYTY